MTQRKPLEILVIDDDPGICDLLKEWIEETGAKVTTAVNGGDGIRQFKEKFEAGTPYDGVITYDDKYTVSRSIRNVRIDKTYPSEVEVPQRIKELSPNTQVYVMSIMPSSNEMYQKLKTQLGELAPDGVITKPFRKQQILDTVQRIESSRTNPPNQTISYQS